MYSSGDGSLTTMPLRPASITGTSGASQCHSRPSGPPSNSTTTPLDSATISVRRHGRRCDRRKPQSRVARLSAGTGSGPDGCASP
jgi:hypothetical protein